MLDAEGEKVAALWLSGEGVVVRRTSSERSPVVAEITPASLAELRLAEGSEVWLSFKATDVGVYPA